MECVEQPPTIPFLDTVSVETAQLGSLNILLIPTVFNNGAFYTTTNLKFSSV